PVIPKYYAGSLQQYHKIQKNTSVFHIVKVIGELATGILRRGAVREIYLGPPGDPRSDPMAFGIVWNGRRQLGDKKGTFGARSDEAHVATQDIQYLRQLIDAQFTNDGPDASDARIAFGGPPRLAVRFGVHPHATELQDRENATMKSHSFLMVKDRPRTFD